jgi:integrase
MRVRLKGIKTVKKKLADGSVKVFHYLRETGAPIVGEEGTPAFMASYNAAVSKLKAPPEGQFRTLIAKYKASTDYADLGVRAKADYTTYIKRIEDSFGDMPIAALEDKRVRAVFMEWRDGLAKHKRAADYAWTTLAGILSWAKDRSLIAENHCTKAGRLYKSGSRAKIIWTPEDLKKLLSSASAEVIAVVLLALWTGQRQGDLLRLPWSAYDGQTIKLTQSKTDKDVVIPIGKTLRGFLDGLEKRSTQILVNSRGRPWTSDGFKSSFGKARTKAGIKDRHFHDLRGTAVTRLALSGCTVPEIASITGHSLLDVNAILDKHYLGGRVELAESAVLKLESRYGEPSAA